MNNYQSMKAQTFQPVSALLVAALLLIIGCANPVQTTTSSTPTSAPASSLPSISVSTDPTTGNNVVTMTSAETAAIRYTLDGTVPTAASPLYSTPLRLVAGTVTVQALAQAQSKGPSAVVTTSVTTHSVTPSIAPTEIKATSVAKIDVKAIGSSIYDPAVGYLDLKADEALDLDGTKTTMTWAQYASGNAIILQNSDGSLYYEFQKGESASANPARAVDAGQLARTAFSLSAVSVKSFLNGKSQDDFTVNYQVSAGSNQEVFEGPLGDICTNMADRSKQTHFLLSAATALVPWGGLPATLSTGVMNKSVSMTFLKGHLPEGVAAESIDDTTPARLVVNKVVPTSVRHVSDFFNATTLEKLSMAASFFDQIFVPGTADVVNYEVKLLVKPELTSLGSSAGLTGPDANGEWTYEYDPKAANLVLNPVTSDTAYRVVWNQNTFVSGSAVFLPVQDIKGIQALNLDVVPYVNNKTYPLLKRSYKVNLKPKTEVPAPPSVPQALTAVGFSPEPGMYTSPVTVTVSRNSSSAQVWYTRNGDVPAQGSSEWSVGSTVRIEAGTVLKAFQTQPGWKDSPVATGVYRIFRIASAPASGTIGQSLSVTVSDATPGTTTTLLVKTSGTEKARGTAVADAQGKAVLTLSTTNWDAGTYTLTALDGFKNVESQGTTVVLSKPADLVPLSVPAPVFSVQGGNFSQDFQLTLTCSANGATIRYTLDGRDPTPGVGTVYSGPIPVSATTTVKAQATVASVASPVTSQNYTRVPTAPVVTVSNPTATGATFSWAPVAGATKYRVFVSTSAITNETVTSIETGLTSYTFTGGLAKTTYHMVVSAQGGGQEVLSKDQTFTTASSSVPQFLLKNANTQETIVLGSSLSLGSLLVGGSASPEFTITNAGSALLKLTGSQVVNLSGPNAAEFALATTPPTEIGSTSVTRFGIRFTPQTTGSKSVTVTIQTNDPSAPNFSFTLTASVGLGSPATLKASSDRYIAVYLEWSEVTGASDFEIERSSNAAFTSATKIRTGFSYNYYDQSVTTPATYYYRVRAVSGNETGVWSPVAQGYRQPLVSSTPGTATVGTLVTQTGTGYTPNQEVLLYVTGPDNQLAGGKPISVKADGSGAIWTQFTIQASKLKGTWKLYAKDVATGGVSFTTTYIIQ